MQHGRGGGRQDPHHSQNPENGKDFFCLLSRWARSTTDFFLDAATEQAAPLTTLVRAILRVTAFSSHEKISQAAHSVFFSSV